MRQLLALDFGGTFLKYSLIDGESVIRERAELPAPLESTAAFVKVIKELYEKYEQAVDGIAISMPGIIDSEKKVLITAGAYTPILGGKNLGDLLKELRVKVSVENDAKAAILAESWKGKLQDSKNGVVLIIGSGLGGGIIIDGKLYKGTHCSAGEFGVVPTEIGNYHPKSTLAHKAGMSAFLKNVALAKNMHPAQFEIAGFQDHTQADSKLPIYSGRDVFQWIEEGDPVTLRVYQEWLDALVHILYSLKLILDPDKILIGGGVSQNPRFLKDLKESYQKTRNLTRTSAILELELDICQYSADANMLGAVYCWMQQFENVRSSEHRKGE